MLKCYLLLIVAISLFETSNILRVYCWDGWKPLKCGGRAAYVEGKDAVECFLAEEDHISSELGDIKKGIDNAKEKLNPIDTFLVLKPKVATTPFQYMWNIVKKVLKVGKDLVYIVKRDHRTAKLKRAKKELEDERKLLFGGGWSVLGWRKAKGIDICEGVFKNKYFTNVKKWVLVKKDKKTTVNKKLWIKVQTVVQTVEGEVKKKTWRISKECVVQKKTPIDVNDKNRPFSVYISAALGYKGNYENIFVYTAVPTNQKDWINIIFFWQRVVQVDAYLR